MKKLAVVIILSLGFFGCAGRQRIESASDLERHIECHSRIISGCEFIEVTFYINLILDDRHYEWILYNRPEQSHACAEKMGLWYDESVAVVSVLSDSLHLTFDIDVENRVLGIQVASPDHSSIADADSIFIECPQDLSGIEFTQRSRCMEAQMFWDALRISLDIDRRIQQFLQQ